MSLETQRQIRENVSEAQEFLRDLDRWQKEMKTREQKREPKEELTPAVSPRRPAEMEVSESLKTVDVTSPMRKSPTQTRPSNSTQTKTAAAVKDAAQTRAEERRAQGNTAFRDGNYGRAISLYTESIHLHKTCVSYANRAMAHLKCNQFCEAEEDCNAALALDPEFLKAYQRRSVARKELGKHEGALEDGEMALRLQPTSDVVRATFHELLSELLQTEGLVLDRSPQQIQSVEILPPPALPAVPVIQKEEKRVTVSSKNDVTASMDAEAVVCSVEKKRSLPAVPKTWAEFEAGYKSLKHQPAAFRDYLAAISPSSLPSVFKTSLTAPTLSSILEAVFSGLAEEGYVDWIAFAKELQFVPRYEMLLMCLSKKQKEAFKERSQLLPPEIHKQLESFLRPFL